MLNPTPLKVAVTGGSGFLGSHLLPLLNKDGYKLSCLCRPHSASKTFPGDVRIVKGDCLDAASLKSFLEGQDVLVHMASALFAPSWQSYLEANTKSTQNILAALDGLPASARPAKVIYISSLAAAGPCSISPGLDEKAVPQPVSAYGWSKFFSEQLFRTSLGDKLLILRPPIIYGSGDRGLLPMFKSAARGLGISPGCFRDFPVSAIHADDVSRAILLLLKRQSHGLYHLSDGKEHDMAALCRAMGKALGKKVKVARLPLPLMAATASLSSAWANIAQNYARSRGSIPVRTPQWNLDKYREASQAGWLADSRLIEKEHGFRTELDLESGMEEAVQGYRRIGLL